MVGREPLSYLNSNPKRELFAATSAGYRHIVVAPSYVNR